MHLFEQRLLVALLAGDRLDVVVRRDVRVGGRVPFIRVDTIEDAPQVAGAVSQDAVEALPVGRRLNLLRVRRADRREGVREHDPRLHERKGAVQLEGPHRIEQVLRQASLQDGERRATPLVPDVVDRKHRGRAVEHPIPVVPQPKQRGHQAGLPVVAMDYVRHPVISLEDIDDRVLEEDEPLVLIGVGRIGGSTVEIMRAVDEMDVDVRVRELAVPGVEREGAQADRDGNVFDIGRKNEPVVDGRDGIIEGKEHLDVAAQRSQGPGQSAADIGEAAGFDERSAFRCSETYVHEAIRGELGLVRLEDL